MLLRDDEHREQNEKEQKQNKNIEHIWKDQRPQKNDHDRGGQQHFASSDQVEKHRTPSVFASFPFILCVCTYDTCLLRDKCLLTCIVYKTP